MTMLKPIQTPVPPLLITFIILTASLSTVHSQIEVWPKPRHVSWPTPRWAHLSHSFSIRSLRDHCHLRHAVRRYLRLLLSERHRPLLPPSVANLSLLHPLLTSLSVSVSNPSASLLHAVDESYNLSVPASGGSARLSAATPWGAMRGLETLSQLAWSDGRRRLVAAGIAIEDAPLMPHRGLMLDTARNFYPVGDLERTIAAMSMNKMNVLHWHLTDAQAFTVELESEPELGRKGSYGAQMRYSAADVRRVVEFGLRHGVRVMPEIDTPGHTGSWAEAYPEIVTCANMFWWPSGTDWADRLASEPGSGQLNPLNQKTYEVLKNVISDVASLFPEPFYHAGADEVVPGCWRVDPMVQKFLSDGGTLSQLLEIFINTTHPYITSLNRTALYWEDVLLDPTIKVGQSVLPKETTILQTWNNGPNNTKQIVAAGYRVIVSSSNYYYLDCGHGGFVGNDSQYDQPSGSSSDKGGSWCAPFKTWQRIYDYDITSGLDPEEIKLVLGGEVALWSEQADPTVLDGRVWPRASAMAEALWSGNQDKSGKKRYAEATKRLHEWRHRMVERGIGAEPIQPLWCVTHPGMCNTVQSD